MSASQVVLRLYNRAATAPVIGPVVRLPIRILRAVLRPIVASPQSVQATQVADERARLEIMMLGAAVDRLSDDVKALRAQLDAADGAKASSGKAAGGKTGARARGARQS